MEGIFTMKKFFAAVLALAMIVTTGVVAFADDDYDEYEHCYPEPSTLRGGETVLIYTSDFYYKDRDGGIESLDCELDKEYFKLQSPTWKKGGSYVEKVYFEDGDDYVTLIIKSGINTSTDKEIRGSIKIRDIDAGRTYTCTIGKDDLTIEAVDEKSPMYMDDDRKFSLPYDYQEAKVKFVTEDGDDYGTFTADFDNDRGTHIAKYVVKIVDQDSLFLGFNETENTTLTSKYTSAKMRFINWDARPTFEFEGRLSIYMEPNQYIYGIKEDNSLYRLGGSYDSENGAYVIKTKTLGSYVVSSKQLMDHTTSQQLSPNAVNNPTPSTPSSVYQPASSTPAAPSSTAPAPSSPSSVAEPEPSSSEPEPEPSSSEPEPEPSSSDPESKPADTKKDDDDEDEDEKKGGFPIIPVLIVVLIVVVVVCGVVVMGNKGGRSSSRRKRFDDWDD